MVHARYITDPQQQLFFTAVRCGDLPGVKRYFELPDVRENVAVWNAIHRAERLQEPSYVQEPRPWYGSVYREENVFISCVDDGRQVELIQWFFAREQLELFGETLRALVKHKLVACMQGRDYTASREIVEIIVNSALFQEVMDDSERGKLLKEMLNKVASRGDHRWVGVLLGYGADPNVVEECVPPLAFITYQDNSRALDLLLARGTWVDDEYRAKERAYDRLEALFCELLARGADANASIGRNGSPLHEAARRCLTKTVRLLINKGFADVDARDQIGRTPIMVVGSGPRSSRRHTGSRKREVVELLLEGGASVHAVDIKGRGVLHHLLISSSHEALRGCLLRDANPNARDANGQTPMSALLRDTQCKVDACVVKMFGELLRAGADPLLPDKHGVTCADRLARTEAGLAFMEEEKAFFRDFR